MPDSEAQVREALDRVVDPDLLGGLESLGMLRSVSVRSKRIVVTLAVPVEGWPGTEQISSAIPVVLREAGFGRDVRVEVAEMTDSERAALLGRLGRPPAPASGGVQAADRAGPGSPARTNPFASGSLRTRVIGISSGKGGVGKSTVTVNLAVALAARGHLVGLLDADVYGFSVPKMMGIDRIPVAIENVLVPPVVHGVRCVSMGFFVPDDQPVIWRGPMLHKALEQFVVDAYWGELDFLLVDMPPGTGDVALSLSQYLPRSEILVVTTPQPAAQRVAQRSAYAARRLKLPVRGVVENLSWFTGDDSRRYELFGSGGGAQLAAELEVPLLAQLPLVPAVREGGDMGIPAAISDPGSEAAAAYADLAGRIVSLGPARVYRNELKIR